MMDTTAQLTITMPIIVTYGLLVLSIMSLWIPRNIIHRQPYHIQLWQVIFLLSLLAALVWQFIHPISLLPIIIFAVGCYLTYQKQTPPWLKISGGLLVTLLAIGLMAHIIPGFSNPKIISNLQLSKDAILYNQFLSFDKALVGLFILAFGHQLLFAKKAWFDMLTTTIPLSAIVVIVVIFLAVLIGYVQFDLKLTALFFLWALPNLFFSCIAEEAFFRGFVQKHLEESLKKYKYGSATGLLLASLLFGLAHYAGGMSYIILATIAGIGYGLVYRQSKSIEASILTHFLVNVVHFIFFTYPVLANAVSK
jgi:membrane protease YdiL (CAAX protease family)